MISPVRKMFDEISKKYDFLNHTLSCFQDVFWRRAACKEIARRTPGNRVLDLCGGTGDFIATYESLVGKPKISVLGDFSLGMLKYSRGKKFSAQALQLDAMQMPFPDSSFDVILNGFGMRNLPDTKRGLEESYRVLARGGYLQVLDFFSPRGRFNTFFYKRLAPLFIPFVGSFFSGKRFAYEYLVQSVMRFYSIEEFSKMAESIGFKTVQIKPCTFGIAFRILLQKKSAEENS